MRAETWKHNFWSVDLIHNSWSYLTESEIKQQNRPSTTMNSSDRAWTRSPNEITASKYQFDSYNLFLSTKQLETLIESDVKQYCRPSTTVTVKSQQAHTNSGKVISIHKQLATSKAVICPHLMSSKLLLHGNYQHLSRQKYHQKYYMNKYFTQTSPLCNYAMYRHKKQSVK